MITKNPKENEQPKPSPENGVVASVVSGGSRTDVFKRKWKTLLAVLIPLIVVLFLANQYYQNRDVYMVVSDRVITTKQYEEAKLAHENYIKAVGGRDADAAPEDPDFVKKQLIFAAALANEAEKADIDVTQEEIDTSFAQLADVYSDGQGLDEDSEPVANQADKVRTFQKDTYGWSADYSNNRQKTMLLQTELKEKLLSQTNVLQVSLVLGADSKLNAQSGKEFLNGTVSPILAEHKGRFIDLAAYLSTKNQYINAQLLQNALDSTVYPDLSEEAKSAISKLDTPGQISQILQTEESVLQMYRLESLTKGEYSSWDDFTNKQLEQTEFINSGLDWRRFTL